MRRSEMASSMCELLCQRVMATPTMAPKTAARITRVMGLLVFIGAVDIFAAALSDAILTWFVLEPRGGWRA